MSFLDNLSAIGDSVGADIAAVPTSDFNFTSVDWASLVNPPAPPVSGLTASISGTLDSLTKPIASFFNTEVAIQQGKNAVAITKATGANQVQVAGTGKPSIYFWAVGAAAVILGASFIAKK